MECRACGTIEATALQPLADMLTGMSGFPGDPIRHHIIALRSPTAASGSSAIALRLLHELPVPALVNDWAREPPGNLYASSATTQEPPIPGASHTHGGKPPLNQPAAGASAPVGLHGLPPEQAGIIATNVAAVAAQFGDIPGAAWEADSAAAGVQVGSNSVPLEHGLGALSRDAGRDPARPLPDRNEGRLADFDHDLCMTTSQKC